MTGSPDNTNLRVALDEATGSLAAARFLPSEAQEGAEWAIYALERLPEDIRDRFAGCISFARDTAAAIIADSESPPPWNNHDLLLLCNDLTTALNTICDQIRPAQPQHKPRKPSKPSIATLIKRAEKAGQRVTSITTPDGITLTFGEPHADAVTPLEQWRKRRGQN